MTQLSLRIFRRSMTLKLGRKRLAQSAKIFTSEVENCWKMRPMNRPGNIAPCRSTPSDCWTRPKRSCVAY